MNNIHIEDSYKIWNTNKMWYAINDYCDEHNIFSPEYYLNRSFTSMYAEWHLHNIGYYITKPFCCFESIRKINLRCKSVDLNEWRRDR